MINKITNKYYEYNPDEFLPIYSEGKLINRGEFNMLKLKKINNAFDSMFRTAIDKAWSI